MPGLLRICTKQVSSLLALLCVPPALCQAEKLPVTIYTTGQGLAHNSVQKVMPDSRGFIWFATREGLSRFDGYTFTNYGVNDGLPSAVINDLVETRDGVYLVATAGGLARLEPNARSRPDGKAGPLQGALFSVHQISNEPGSRSVLTLYEDRRGTVWIGTRAGLFAVENASGAMTFRFVPIGMRPTDPIPWVLSIREDRFGALWVGATPGARRLWPDGRIETYFLDVEVQSILEDRAGHLWLGTRSNGLRELTFDESSGRVARWMVHSTVNGLPNDWINTLFEPRAGELWVGTPAGLVQITGTATGPLAFRLLTQAHGLSRGEIQSFAMDRTGNYWAGLHDGGADKIARSGFSTFGAEDGFLWGTNLLQTRSGELCFAGPTGTEDSWGLYCFNGTSFDRVRTSLRGGAGGMSWGWKQIVLEDHVGDWWFATRDGVARFTDVAGPRGLAGRRPNVWYGRGDGPAGEVILALFEDSRGDVWMGAVREGGRSRLLRWERNTNTLHHYSDEPDLPDLNAHYPTIFAEDRAGNVWTGFSGAGGVARYRNGRFERLETRNIFRATIRDILLDSSGRLWFATYDGLFRVDDPSAASPVFARYGTTEGLSSNETSAIVADAEGRLYVATARGLDRIEPRAGRIKHFSASDGVPVGAISAALLDARTGHLWFTHRSGVSRLIPPAGPSGVAPPIFITAVQVDGAPQPLQALGEGSVPALELQHDRNDLRIDFVALSFSPGEDLRYQYRLEGAQGDWSMPANQRTVNFANLAPGAYRFVVRAISADGMASPEPASVTLTIVPPVWRRWWFVALALAFVSLSISAAYRYRLARAVEIATIRTRIATDLHDDIGANLTKIAILSEVTRLQLEGNGEAGDRLSAIARISRESVASMSDVVWAINPKRDTLRDTIRRMRQHAEEVFAGRGVDLQFHAPDGGQNLRVPIDVRRDFLLIFKEALNNVVRHSQCRRVRIDVQADDVGLHLRLTDDGVGFETDVDSTGNGLASMRRRAAKMDASLDVVSAPGHGTTVSLSVPGSFGGRLRYPA